MKITIEYEEEEDAKLALEAFDWKHTLLELDQLLKSTTKHNIYQNREASEDEHNMAHYIREQLREFANDNNLTL